MSSAVRSVASVAVVLQGAPRPQHVVLFLVGLFGGTAHALPEQLYLGGAIGPFDILVLLLLAWWLLCTGRRITQRTLRTSVPFYILAAAAYIAEVIGGVVFGANTWSGLLAPLRFLYYPSLFFTLQPLLTTPGRLKILFVSFVGGVLLIALLAWIRSPDPTFFFGLPVLENPNVIGNFISYGAICLGFCFMPRTLIFKAGALLVLFVLALFTFSKAAWLLMFIGIYINASQVARWRLLVLGSALVLAFFAFADSQQVFELASEAIDLKLTASVGDENTGGTLYMRGGFLLTSLYSLIDYPFGIGLKNFWLLNHSYATELGMLYFDSDSPHTALGFMTVQAGWIGVLLLLIIFAEVMAGVLRLYGRPQLPTKLALAAMLLISIFFQIEFLTQPFIYLVLSAALAMRAQPAFVIFKK